jgi:hypothetical protein
MMNLPKKNLCLIDRVIRGCVSLSLLVFAVLWAEQIGDVVLQVLIIIFAGLNFISFAIGWCPVYKLANISTCKK